MTGIVVFFVLIAFTYLGIVRQDAIMNGENNCFVFRHFHIFCPGCGGTRAYVQLIHGKILQSFLYNPVVITGLVSYLFFMGNTTLRLITKKFGFKGFPVTAVVFANLGVMILQCIIRNILFLTQGIAI